MDPQIQAPQDGQQPPELHPLVVLRPGERVICEIKRHPFGVISMYASGAFAIIVITVLAILAPSYIGEFTFEGNVQSIALGIAAIMSIGVIAILLLATSIYWLTLRPNKPFCDIWVILSSVTIQRFCQ